MKEYYISDGQNTIGPLSKLKLFSQNITKETLVWYEGLNEWKRAGDIEELADLFSNRQIPPPIPKQKPLIQPRSESTYQHHNSMMETEPKGKKKTTKKIVFWCCGIFVLLCVLAVVGYNVYEHEQYKFEQEQYESTKSRESLHPGWYLSMENTSINDNTLSGNVLNSSKYTTYNQIKIQFSYYDKNGAAIQSNVHIIKGTFFPQSSTPFKVKIRPPQGTKNYFNSKSYGVKIIGAEVEH